MAPRSNRDDELDIVSRGASEDVLLGVFLEDACFEVADSVDGCWGDDGFEEEGFEEGGFEEAGSSVLDAGVLNDRRSTG